MVHEVEGRSEWHTPCSRSTPMGLASKRHFEWLSLVFGLALALAACTARVPGEGVSDDDPRAVLRGQFNSDVRPLIQRNCAQCHDGSMPLIGWMEVDEDYPTIYDRVMSWPALINIVTPEQSRLVTKGAHDGPAWASGDLPQITAWIESEAAFGSTGNEVDTMAITPAVGPNEFDLGAIGVGDAAGCLLRFQYDFSPPIVTVNDIRVQGDADGCVLDQPVVGVVTDPDGDGTETTWYDPNHKFQNLSVVVGANEEVPIGSVTASWVPPEELEGTIKLQFRFYGVEASSTGGGGGGETDGGM